MHIVAWNLGHQTRERRIADGFVDAVRALSPDVLVLNEYVHGESRKGLLDGLRHMGLEAVSISSRVNGENQVLIATRQPHKVGPLVGPSTTPSGLTNFLHIQVAGLDVVGIRAPAYEKRAQLTDYWNQLEALITGTKACPIIFIGDLNCGFAYPKSVGGRALMRLRENGWQIPEPDGNWSYISKNGSVTGRIDYAICGPELAVRSAKYITQIEEVILAGPTTSKAISDHAAHVVEVGL